MKTTIYLLLLFFVPFLSFAQSEKQYQSFHFKKQVVVPGDSITVFDWLTGDISPWWDHTFSKKPHKLYIEPKPGGGFWEIFNENGDGVLHATVIAAHRGKLLRFDGPLGLSGKAVQLVCTYQLTGVPNDSTRLVLEVNGAGAMNEQLPKIIEKVWDHFIFEQFVPFSKKKFNELKRFD
ncbi:SRPBCC domain-containing protein [Prolixibacteraceae bacterium JC049]|nr:SRPBCC domain-containing protein [Prolixibacteraceae bacterium JC049]